MSVRSVAMALLIAAAPVSAADVSDPDLFIGTLTVERGEVILARCDLGATRYVLRDAAGSQAVARFRQDGATGYAEVIASYAQENGRDILTVLETVKVVGGRNCRLGDALERFGTKPPQP